MPKRSRDAHLELAHVHLAGAEDRRAAGQVAHVLFVLLDVRDRDRLVLPRFEVRGPAVERAGVVRAQALDVDDLEAVESRLFDDEFRRRDVAAGEDLGVDEVDEAEEVPVLARPAGRRSCAAASRRRPAGPERHFWKNAGYFGLPKCSNAPIDTMRSTRTVERLPALPCGTKCRACDAARRWSSCSNCFWLIVRPITFTPYASFARIGRRAPAAADVEQRHARRELALAERQVDLRALCLSERRIGRVELRARIGHRFVEEQRVKIVADVVVRLHALEVDGLRATTGVHRRVHRSACLSCEREIGF